MRMRFVILFAAACFPCSALLAQNVLITVTGDWNLTLDVTDLQGGAGSNLVGTHSSAVDVTRVTLKKDYGGTWWEFLINFDWRVDISKSDTNWDANLQLWTRRTGNGTGLGSISGGTAYQQVTGVDSYFFNGNFPHYNIPIQYQVRGVSVQVPADSYETTVVYTITEL